MRWRLRPKPKRVPGEYPESFVKAWMARTLPSATPAEAASAVAHLRTKGWTEEKLAAFILPYMPREGGRSPRLEAGGATSAPAPSAAAGDWAPVEQPVAPPSDEQPGAATEEDPPFALPPDVTRSWLDAHLPRMDRRQLRLAVDELERRGWPSGAVALAVLPHLLPTREPSSPASRSWA